MGPVTTALVARACRTFMGLAYPGGPATIPPRKRVYFNLPLDRPVSDFLPPAPAAEGIVHAVQTPGGAGGWAFRLGSARFYASVTIADEQGNDVTVLLGDGKGGFSKAKGSPFPAGHNPNDIAVGDFNRDGKLDLAFANHEAAGTADARRCV